MARRVYFAFHFENDIWRANQVRNSNVVAGVDLAGFFDHSEYEEAKRKGDEEIKRQILAKLDNTTVTVVLIGTETASRTYVKYEIEQSIARKNGLLGVYIDHLKDESGETSTRGPKPAVPPGIEFPTYVWDGNLKSFARAIEEAGRRADALREAEKKPQPPPRKDTGFGTLVGLGLAGLAAAVIALSRNVQGRLFSNQTVLIDGRTYTNCTFANCLLVTHTGDFRIRSCTFDGCAVQYDPNAQYGPNTYRVTRLVNAVEGHWPGYYPGMNADGTITIE